MEISWLESISIMLGTFAITWLMRIDNRVRDNSDKISKLEGVHDGINVEREQNN